MRQGYVKLHRKLLDSAVMRDDWLCRLWVWILIKASHTDLDLPGKGKLRAGSFVTGQFSASAELSVHPSKWRRGVKRLSHMGQIAVKSTNHQTIITVCNWKTYQSDDPPARPTGDQPATNRAPAQRPTSDQPATTYKNGRMEEEIPPNPPGGGGGVSGTLPDDEIGWLVREWFHVYRGAAKATMHDELRDGFAELLRLGWSADAVKLAITDRARPRTEWPSTFFARATKGGRPAAPAETPAERKARIAAKRRQQEADDARIAAEREAALEILNGRKPS